MTVTVTHLEMTDPSALRPSAPVPDLTLREVRDPAVNAALYGEVGDAYRWHDRLSWTAEQWETFACSPDTKTLLGELDGETVGYAELVRRPGQAVELHLFGLRPPFLGRGLGGPLLTLATEAAWTWGAGRVVVHTCTLDHPRALPGYLARGFTVERTETRP